MSIKIEVIKEGAVESSFSLKPGVYTLGRGNACNIVLPDVRVSANHAEMSVSEDKVTVKDTGSSNGIYFRDEKINDRSFDADFELEIGPFILRCTKENGSAVANDNKLSLMNLASSNIKTTLFLFMFIVSVVTFISIYIPLKGQLKEFRSDEFRKRGVYLARYLAEINRDYMEEGQYHKVRLNPVSMEEGVLYSYIVDTKGKVLVPIEEAGSFVDRPDLLKSIRNGQLLMADGEKNETVFYYPIKGLNDIIGASIVGYDINNAIIASEFKFNILFYGAVILILFLCAYLGSVSIEILFNPLKRLEDEVSVAIKAGGRQLKYEYPYEEINNLSEAFSRLLASSSASVSHRTEMPASVNLKSDINGGVAAYMPLLNELTSPWCIIDTENFTIKHSDISFRPFLKEGGDGYGKHILEAFKSNDISSAVSALIDGKDNSMAVAADPGIQIDIKKISISGAGNDLLLVFREHSDG